MGRDGVYRYDPYIPVPVRDEWLHRADGLIYRNTGYMLDSAYCMAPIAEYSPTNREIWFSWPDSTAQGINNWCLVAATQQKTADVVDHGFTALINFRFTPASAQECNEQQFLLGASGTDWAIKSIGESVFNRELYPVTLDDDGLPTVDIPEATDVVTTGYYSILRGMIPLGLTDREKKIRKVLVDHGTAAQADPCVMQLRIGNSYSLVDPNDTAATCVPQWRVIKADSVNGIINPLLQCPDQTPVATQAANGTRTNKGMSWPCLEFGKFIYYELTIQNANGSAAIGADTAMQRIDFDAAVQPKP
jgi:hypothetical protein